MRAELVFDGGRVHIPSTFAKPREDQMQGTWAEQLCEVAGRTCYESMGVGRPSGEYHKNLFEVQRHFSVAEHVHQTIETDLDPIVWLGIPDIAVSRVESSHTRWRLTLNLRHILEWPNNVTFGGAEDHLIYRWEKVLREVGHFLCPQVFGPVDWEGNWNAVDAYNDSSAFVSLFLEESLTWSHEQVRHRGNISQRSGRFCDQTDRDYCIHPLFRDYLNEVGYLKNETPDSSDPDYWQKWREVRQQELRAEKADLYEGKPPRQKGETDEPVWEGGTVDDAEAMKRSRIGNAVGSLEAQAKLVYKSVVDALQPYAQKKLGLDPVAARKQARSAGRYYLPSALSSEMVATCSIRHWRHIFNMRCSPHADAAIRELMERARELVKGSRYGHFL